MTVPFSRCHAQGTRRSGLLRVLLLPVAEAHDPDGTRTPRAVAPALRDCVGLQPEHRQCDTDDPMALSPRVVARLTALATLASTAVALLGALAMSDRVRLVDIILLFFGGFGAGAGLASLLVQRRRYRREGARLPG